MVNFAFPWSCCTQPSQHHLPLSHLVPCCRFFGVDVNGFDDKGLRNGTHHVCMNSGWRKKPRYSNHANRSSMSRCVVGSKSSMVVGGEAFFKGLRRSPPRVHARYSSCSLGIVGGGVHSPSKESWTSDSWLSPSPVTSASSRFFLIFVILSVWLLISFLLGLFWATNFGFPVLRDKRIGAHVVLGPRLLLHL